MGAVGAERRIINVSAGTIAAGSTDAVNGGQLYTTNQNVAALQIDVTGLQTDLATEIATRAAADATLQSNIDAEAATRAAADTTLQSNIDAEAAARAAADAVLAAADATLQSNIDAETAARAAADTTLQSNIDAEAAARAAADAVHTADIATINGRFDGNSINFGTNSTASVNAVAIGVGQSAIGNGAVAIGDPNNAAGTGAVAIGANNTATGDGAVALGNGSTAATAGSVAIGNGAFAGTDGIALGNGATNGEFTNSVALGAGTINTANNQVAVGGRSIGGVAAGALNATSTEAVNGSQLFATNQAVAALSSQIGGISAMQDEISTLFDLRDKDRKDTRQGVAIAIAMANAPIPSTPGGISYAVNGAVFRGEYAAGGSVSYRLNTASPTAISVGFSYAGNKSNGVRVGVAGEF